MNILVISQHFYPEQFRINDICFELAKLGHKVTVLTGLPNYPTGVIDKEYRFFRKRIDFVQNVKIIRVPIIARGNSLLRMGLNYLSFAVMGSIYSLFLYKRDVSFVYQTSPVSMAIPGIFYKWVKRTPLIIHCLDQWPISVTIGPIKEESIFYTFLTKLSKWVYSSANLITVGSKSFINYFIHILNIAKEEKTLMYWPAYAESTYEDIDEHRGLEFNIVFAGNIGPAQDVENIIHAANLLKDYESIRIHIVGDGLNRKSCEDLALQYKLNNVTFHGQYPVSEMKQFYDLADVFIITMVDHEVVNQTLPAKVQSYMMAKKAIIGAIKGEVKRVIEEADCGFVCEPSDAKALKDCMIKAYQSKEDLSTFGLNARKYYESHFRKDVLMNELETLFSKTIGETHAN